MPRFPSHPALSRRRGHEECISACFREIRIQSKSRPWPAKLDQVTLTAGDKSVVLPVLRPARSATPASTSPSCRRKPAASPTTPASPRPPACKSAITYIDGDAGVLLYRGYPIEQLAKQSSFLEVGLPADERRAADQPASSRKFDHEVTHHTMMHEAFKNFLGGFRHDAHPMAMLVGMLGSMAASTTTTSTRRSGSSAASRRSA